MADRFPHLRFDRLAPANPRRRRRGFARAAPPADPAAHGTQLRASLERAGDVSRQQPGFDPRLLLKLRVVGVSADQLRAIPGIQVVSEEGDEILVLFADQTGLDTFRKRLSQLSRGQRATRQDILFAIKGFEGWTREDRTGPALRAEGMPSGALALLDVELWPLESVPERRSMAESFREWCRDRQIEILDSVDQETVILRRVRLQTSRVDELLDYRDVREVDLPPRYQIAFELLGTPIDALKPVGEPAEGAPGVVILDSGLTSGHPLLAPAVGDAQGFVPGMGAEDATGHGTLVAGIALYHDFDACLGNKRFEPSLRIFSGRIIERNDVPETQFVENRIIQAVEYFTREYGCKVFNLSFGDRRKPYVGGHVRGLAAILDSLSRTHGILFVVSAGNFDGTENGPSQWLDEYPEYLLGNDDARVIDPAPALNALTVGSLARYETSRMGIRFPNDPAYQPVARKDCPSPFTRAGLGPQGAIKPEVVDYGGNAYVDTRVSPQRLRGQNELGEIGPAHDYLTSGRLFSVDGGTSYAAPKVAHIAGRLTARYPAASAPLLRALVVAHSRIPESTRALIPDDGKQRRLVGYGKCDPEHALYSEENRVTLLSESSIGENEHHFYELPIPEDFLRPPARRPRSITVSLAYAPIVRRTRIQYRASELAFRLVRRESIEEIERVFRRTAPEDQERVIPEYGNLRPTSKQRSRGTVQAATGIFQQVDSRWAGKHLFVVVTRTVPVWAVGLAEEEPYALVVVLEDPEMEGQVRYYTQIQQMLRVRVRL